MAEAFGLAASIIGLSATAVEVSKVVFNFVETLKDSPQIVSDLGSTVLGLSEILNSLTDRSGSSTLTVPYCKRLGPQSFQTAVQGCERDLNRLDILVKRLKGKGTDTRVRKARTSLYWLFIEKQLVSIKTALESHKSLLGIHLSLSIKEDTERVSKIEEDTSKIPKLYESTERVLALVEVVAQRGAQAEQESDAAFRAVEETIDSAVLEDDDSTETANDDSGEHDNGDSAKPENDNSNEAKHNLAHMEEQQRPGSLRQAAKRDEALHSPTPDRTRPSPRALGEDERLQGPTGNEVIIHQPIYRIKTPELVKALTTAARNGLTDVVRLLLSTGVDVDAYDDECTALWLAASAYHADIVEMLLQHGADPRLPRKKGTSPLVHVVSSGFNQFDQREPNRVRTVELLLRYGGRAV